jgi:formyl-CoA transferase
MMALAGMRVLDLTQHLSGPYCTMILGDLGAEVLKIEKPEGGDDQRKLGPFVNGESSPFMMINRNKKSLTLNLKAPEGRQILMDLAKQADVLIENFRPGIVRSLQIDYEAVRAVNPGIVYCSISGYGQTGPYSQKGGFDIMAQGMTGMMDLNSQAGQRPNKTPVSLHASYFVTGSVPKVQGTRNHLSAPYQAYRARDGYVLVGAGNQKLWEEFCRKVVERPEWIQDPRFDSPSERIRHADDLERMLEEVLAQQDISYWVARLEAAGVPGGPINSYDQALQDPHFRARGMVQEVEHPRAGSTRTLGIPAKMSLTPGAIRLPAPVLGQHTQEILTQLLGLTEHDVAGLRTRRVI